jgi:hypothetical protein
LIERQVVARERLKTDAAQRKIDKIDKTDRIDEIRLLWRDFIVSNQTSPSRSITTRINNNKHE